ncbi:MAG TPA: hypothetical protein PLW44_01525 [Chitinophagales bacterium]|nr:hypothetical protein [Chitinophagales bacterium]
MLANVSGWLYRIANVKTLLAAIAVYLVFGAYVMPTGTKTFAAKAGQQVEILDLQFNYTPAKARQIIDLYGTDARAYAVKFGLIADTLYPLAYTFLFLIITSLIFKNLKAKGIDTGSLHLFPLVIVPVDYLENISIANLLLTHPGFSDKAAQIASFFTSLKWCLVAGLVLITFGGLITLLLKKTPK